MPGDRTLWTGPYGSALRDHLIAGASSDPTSLWIAPTPMARDQLRRELAIRLRTAGPMPRVWTWEDLWARVREGSAEGPSCLSDASAGAVFLEALRQARQARELEPIASVVVWPGYRDQLRRRFDRWTRAELNLRSRAPADPVSAAERTVFARYRGLLRQLGAEDAAGLAVWASRRLSQRPPSTVSAFEQVTFLDWPTPARAQRRVLDHALRRSGSVRVTLAYEDDETSAPVYEAMVAARAELLDLGFAEHAIPAVLWRPSGLRVLEQSLFRNPGTTTRVKATQGLVLRGVPHGEGCARELARAVRDRLDQGDAPEDILILFRRWGEAAEIARDMLDAWGIPVKAEPKRPLGSDPAVAALLLAAGLPVDEWATDRVIRLLRNGQVRPGWSGSDPMSMAASASLVKATPVFRGREPLLNALDRQIHDEARAGAVRANRARAARDLVERILEVLAPLDQPRPFAAQMAWLFHVADELGLGQADPDGTAGLDRLHEILDDQAGVLEQLGRGETPWRWSSFVERVASFAMEMTTTNVARPAGVRLATVDEAEGARAGHIILADLGEGSFPAREAVEKFLEVRPGEAVDEDTRRAYSEEMLRFLRVIGSAEASLVLIYPTTDAKGQELLRAGFLDEVIECLAPEALEACHRSIRRLDPALVDAPELAGAPADRRVRAVAIARERGEASELVGLSRRIEHRPALDGTALALAVTARRLRGTPFGEYDGLLKDGHVILDIAEAFPPGNPFSASQLETYIDCPFQFFCKYVLNLKPSERREEIDEDFTERGSKIHDMLEALEERKAAGQVDDLEELERAVVDDVMRAEPVDASEVVLGLREIERRRLIRTLHFYRVQHERYEATGGIRPIPHQFEVSFGDETSGNPALEIGRGQSAVKLQGKIDRIDIMESHDGSGFRIIDYKSGHGPSVNDVKQGRRLQLPLYAMAVERLGLAGEGAGLHDLGYWALRKEGYKPIAFEEWPEAREAIEAYVIALVDRLRQGIFVVDSQLEGCEGFCDYRAICRVRQARLAAKQHDGLEPPDLKASRRRK